MKGFWKCFPESKQSVNIWAAVLVLLAAMVLTGGCAADAENLMKAVKADPQAGYEKEADAAGIQRGRETLADFGVRLLQHSQIEEGNTLLSPLSVLCALSMTANGAQGETLAQMEETLGLSLEELNPYIRYYTEQLPSAGTYHLSVANSVWLREGFRVKEAFLQTNADFYRAEVYRASFDGSTLKEMNHWVKEKTEGMIPAIIDHIPSEAMMYLVNALAFDARWDHVYQSNQVRERTFTKEDGTEQEVSLMFSLEETYLEDEMSTGFLKYYDDRRYAFAALLPREGVSVAEYVKQLTGTHLSEMLSSPQEVPVDAAIPKFEREYTAELNEILCAMGMPDAFDSTKADFGALGEAENNLYLSNVLHKTFITVGEEGTKAGAATVVAVAEGAAELPEQTKSVVLDRPFVYLLIDCEEKVPLFIGTFMDAE